MKLKYGLQRQIMAVGFPDRLLTEVQCKLLWVGRYICTAAHLLRIRAIDFQITLFSEHCMLITGDHFDHTDLTDHTVDGTDEHQDSA